MSVTMFQGRRAVEIENEALRVTVLEEGGHIAEVFDKRAGVSALWVPNWRSIEPSAFDPHSHTEFGSGSDAVLLAGIMGHNLCMDIFGGPSAEEAAAGLSAHGEGSVNRYEITESGGELVMRSIFPIAQLAFTRSLKLDHDRIQVRETVENLTAVDRPIAWTQHVTLAPPFLAPATTEFRASMAQSVVAEGDPGANAYLKPGAEFIWPLAPRRDDGVSNLCKMHPSAPASGYTAHLTDPSREDAFFVAFSPEYRLAFGYVWKRADFPWMGIWEENCSRLQSPWLGKTITRGMEFGVSPFPESRREMVDRGRLLGAPTYRWLPSRGTLDAEYWIVSKSVDVIPESLNMPQQPE